MQIRLRARDDDLHAGKVFCRQNAGGQVVEVVVARAVVSEIRVRVSRGNGKRTSRLRADGFELFLVSVDELLGKARASFS